jgi:hypothetical protein
MWAVVAVEVSQAAQEGIDSKDGVRNGSVFLRFWSIFSL